MREIRKSGLRGVAVLAAVLLAAGAISPALSAFNPTKAKIKKLAAKQVKKLGPGLFVEETEFDRIGPIKMSTGAPDQTLFTFGPFTATVRCDLDVGDVRGQVFIQTSEIGSFFTSYDQGNESPFDPAGGEVLWFDATGNPPGGIAYSDDSEHDSPASAWAPSGATFSAMIRILTNFGGSHCLFDGYVIDMAA